SASSAQSHSQSPELLPFYHQPSLARPPFVCAVFVVSKHRQNRFPSLPTISESTHTHTHTYTMACWPVDLCMRVQQTNTNGFVVSTERQSAGRGEEKQLTKQSLNAKQVFLVCTFSPPCPCPPRHFATKPEPKPPRAEFGIGVSESSPTRDLKRCPKLASNQNKRNIAKMGGGTNIFSFLKRFRFETIPSYAVYMY
ncbi:Hypothetical predicted protein, partial [Drosophila guanche]